jgi:hypothetical protein
MQEVARDVELGVQLQRELDTLLQQVDALEGGLNNQNFDQQLL